MTHQMGWVAAPVLLALGLSSFHDGAAVASITREHRLVIHAYVGRTSRRDRSTGPPNPRATANKLLKHFGLALTTRQSRPCSLSRGDLLVNLVGARALLGDAHYAAVASLFDRALVDAADAKWQAADAPRTLQRLRDAFTARLTLDEAVEMDQAAGDLWGDQQA